MPSSPRKHRNKSPVKARQPRKQRQPQQPQQPQSAPVPSDLRPYYTVRPLPEIAPSLGLQHVQSFFPALETLFPSVKSNRGYRESCPCLGATELVTDITSDSVATVEHLKDNTVRDQPIWIRRVHLVNPVDVMEGVAVVPVDGALPSVHREAWQETLFKVNDPMNEAYTDAVCSNLMSLLVETRRSPHFCRFFGTFNGRVAEYDYNITEDMQAIEGKRWFKEGLQAGAFRVYAADRYTPGVTADWRRPLQTGGRAIAVESSDGLSVSGEPIEELEDGGDAVAMGSGDSDELTEIRELRLTEEAVIIPRAAVKLEAATATEVAEGSGTSEESYSESDDSYEGVDAGADAGADDDDDEDEDEDEDEDDDEDTDYHAVLNNFPVQCTVLERCEGTLDSLMDLELKNESIANGVIAADKDARWSAWIFQVIAGLSVAQQYYGMVHNDLHTNNIVWTKTDAEYLLPYQQ